MQGALDFVDQVGILELPHREVHAHRYPGTVAVLVAPLCCLAASFLQHPLPDGDDEAGLFGDLDELRGHHEAVSRVSPPHQGLHFGYGASIERNLGLVVDLEALWPPFSSAIILSGWASTDRSWERHENAS